MESTYKKRVDLVSQGQGIVAELWLEQTTGGSVAMVSAEPYFELAVVMVSAEPYFELAVEMDTNY